MNILKYMAFIRTVEYRSFTKAAEMLNYSQSGISRMIHDLGAGVEGCPPGAQPRRCAPDLGRDEAAAPRQKSL